MRCPRYRLPLVLLALLPVAVAVPAAGANGGGIKLQRILDSPFSLRLRRTALSKVFADIARKAAISIQVENSVYAALPYGATTRVSATFRNASLRTAIDKVLSPLGLRDATSGNHLIIMPSPALARIGRRATWNELKLLQAIRRTQLSQFSGNWTADLRRTLGRSALTVQVASNDTTLQAQAMAKVRSELPTTVAQALDTYAVATHQIWFIRRDTVQIISQHEWLQHQLKRPIVVHFTNAPLESVVTRLSQLSGIRFKPDPGLYLAVPAVSVDSSNGTVQQTLDVLSGAARIAYKVRRHYILLHLAGKSDLARPTRDSIIGTIRMPLGKGRGDLDLFLRRSDLPDSVYHGLQKRLHHAVKLLRHSLLQGTVPGTVPTSPAPTTKPGTAPATPPPHSAGTPPPATTGTPVGTPGSRGAPPPPVTPKG